MSMLETIVHGHRLLLKIARYIVGLAKLALPVFVWVISAVAMR